MFIPDSEDAIKVYEQKNAINKDATLGNYYITKEKYESLKGFEVFPNDIIVSCAGTIGETYVMPPNMRKGIINQALMKISLYCLEMLDFYLTYFDFKLKTDANKQGYGVALKNIPPFDILKIYLVPIPPINEQQKIIREIENAFSYIETIDNNHLELESTIITLKSKILDLAIQGKLVAQDPNDEPASVLLERIRAEKEELIKQGKIKRDKKESIIFKGEDNSYYEKYGDTITCIDSEIPFKIPDEWTWCRLQDVCIKDIKRGKAPKYSDLSDTIVFAQKCNTKTGLIDVSRAKFLDNTTLKKYLPEDFLRYNDIIINSTGTGTLGRIGIFRKDDNTRNIKIVPDSHITTVRVSSSNLNSLYVYYFLKYNQSHFEDSGVGSTNQKELKPETVSEFLIAIPPIDEQTAIITKIDELFSSFDCIETSLK